jgi:hypothetical protein
LNKDRQTKTDVLVKAVSDEISSPSPWFAWYPQVLFHAYVGCGDDSEDADMRSFRRIKVWGLTVVVTVVSSIPMPAYGQIAPVVTRSGDHFNVSYNGGPAQPRFLLFLSYFGAFRRAGSARTGMTAAEKAAHLLEIRTDFINIRQAGFQGVRIFPNWIWSWDTGADQCDATDQKTLMSVNGVRSDVFQFIGQVLEIAGQEQLVVDLSFNMEQVRTIGDTARLMKPGYRDQLAIIAATGAGLFKHVIFDLENEANGSVQLPNCPKEKFSDGSAPTLLDLRNAVKGADAGRLVSASFANEETLYNTAVYSHNSQFDFVAFHDSRQAGWPARVATDLDYVRGWMAFYGIWYPIYYQEPQIAEEATLSELQTAACNARTHGAAAWTLHTEDLFKVAPSESGLASGIRNPLSTNVSQFAASIPAIVSSCAWLHNP